MGTCSCIVRRWRPAAYGYILTACFTYVAIHMYVVDYVVMLLFKYIFMYMTVINFYLLYDIKLSGLGC